LIFIGSIGLSLLISFLRENSNFYLHAFSLLLGIIAGLTIRRITEKPITGLNNINSNNLKTKKMKKYLGVKIVSAEPMDSASFETKEKRSSRNVVDGLEREGTKEGYKVVYEDGYVSWSPKDVFEKAYRCIDNLTFGMAIEALKQGKKVARKGWNGKGMWLKLARQNVTGNDKNAFSTIDFEEDGLWATLPTICMKTAGNEMLPGWSASQTDILAEDWVIVE
jgi:hypothetical protein